MRRGQALVSLVILVVVRADLLPHDQDSERLIKMQTARVGKTARQRLTQRVDTSCKMLH